MTKRIKKLKIILLTLSILLFIIALTQRGYAVDHKFDDKGSAIIYVLLGGVGLLGFGGAFTAWLANPLLIISWILPHEKLVWKIVLSALAVLFSLSFLLFSEIIKDEAGHIGKITGYGAGYWIWVSSSLLYFIGNLYLLYIDKWKIGANFIDT